MDAIAKSVGINKATIYYHFKDKRDIIVSLFKRSIQDLETKVSLADNPDLSVRDHISMELDYMRSKKGIITVMMMEALKSDSASNFLFDVADIIMKNEIREATLERCCRDKEFEAQYISEEFFMGVLPFFYYIIFEDRWAERMKLTPNQLKEFFISAFEAGHLANHK